MQSASNEPSCLLGDVDPDEAEALIARAEARYQHDREAWAHVALDAYRKLRAREEAGDE